MENETVETFVEATPWTNQDAIGVIRRKRAITKKTNQQQHEQKVVTII